MRYLCTNCNYIYDEAEWDREEEIESGERFEDLGDHFRCPVCWESEEFFHEIREEVQYIENEYSKDPLEIDHFIETEVKNDKLFVTVGNGIHPMWESHRISSVALYDDYGDLIEEKFLGIDEDPITEFDFDDLWEFEIRVRCNLHGVWWKKVIQ